MGSRGGGGRGGEGVGGDHEGSRLASLSNKD